MTKMKQNQKTLLALMFSALLTGLLVMSAPSFVLAAAIGAGGTVKARVNSAVSAGEPIRIEEKGVKQFEAMNTATAQLVVDEAGNAPTNGALVSVELSTGTCFAVVLDSAAASGNDETTTARALIPPVVANTSTLTVVEFKYAKQFVRGLVLKVSSAACRATVGWKRNGGSD